MNNVYKIIFEESVEDIVFFLEIKEDFTNLYRNHINDVMGQVFHDMIQVLNKRIIIMIKEHNKKWQDNLSVRKLTPIIEEDKLTTAEAKKMIAELSKSDYKLLTWESAFVGKIINNHIYGPASNFALPGHMSITLKGIYAKSRKV